MTDDIRAVARDMLEWIKKVTDDNADHGSDSSAGFNYLNGDGKKYPGYGWDDLDALVVRLRAALASTKM